MQPSLELRSTPEDAVSTDRLSRHDDDIAPSIESSSGMSQPVTISNGSLNIPEQCDMTDHQGSNSGDIIMREVVAQVRLIWHLDEVTCLLTTKS
jgi:hypothetical protein